MMEEFRLSLIRLLSKRMFCKHKDVEHLTELVEQYKEEVSFLKDSLNRLWDLYSQVNSENKKSYVWKLRIEEQELIRDGEKYREIRKIIE